MSRTATPPETVAIALGSNLGDRLANLRAAVAALQPFFAVTAASPIYETPAAYVTDQPAFLNAILLGTTTLEPLDLLHALKQAEATLGRIESFRFGPRLIDMDIVFYGDRQLATPALTLPHPRMAEREFVLRPLADVAGGWRHPDSGVTIAAMLESLPDQTACRLKESL